jgi:hypothetical protein
MTKTNKLTKIEEEKKRTKDNERREMERYL